MGSFTPGKIFIEELWVSGTMTGRHSLQGIPGKEWELNTGLPNPIIYIGLVVLCVMLSTRSSLRTNTSTETALRAVAAVRSSPPCHIVGHPRLL